MSYAVTSADKSRCLYIDSSNRLRFQDFTCMSFEVIGSNSRTGILLDPFTSATSTMPYAPNDFAPALSHNEPGEAEEYAGLSAPTLGQKLSALISAVLVIGLVLLGLVVTACASGLTKHKTPAWKRTAMRDPEPPRPDTTSFQL
jgi:hypothetical protein